MPNAEDHFTNARNHASDHLKKMKDRSPEAVRKLAEIAASSEERTAGLLGEPVRVDVNRLEAELRHLFSVSAETATHWTTPPATNRGCLEGGPKCNGASGIAT